MCDDEIRAICEEFGIAIVPNAENGRRPKETSAIETLRKICRQRGARHLRTVVMSLMETGHDDCLTRPVISAVSDVLNAHPELLGGGFLAAFDKINFGDLYEFAWSIHHAVPLREALTTLIFQALPPVGDLADDGGWRQR